MKKINSDIVGTLARQSGFALLVQRIENAFGRNWQFRDSHSNRVLDGICNRSRDSEHPAFADTLCSVWTWSHSVLLDKAFERPREIRHKRHAICPRVGIRRSVPAIDEFLEKALPQGLQSGPLDLSMTGCQVERSSGICSYHQPENRDLPGVGIDIDLGSRPTRHPEEILRSKRRCRVVRDLHASATDELGADGAVIVPQHRPQIVRSVTE